MGLANRANHFARIRGLIRCVDIFSDPPRIRKQPGDRGAGERAHRRAMVRELSPLDKPIAVVLRRIKKRHLIRVPFNSGDILNFWSNRFEFLKPSLAFSVAQHPRTLRRFDGRRLGRTMIARTAMTALAGALLRHYRFMRAFLIAFMRGAGGFGDHRQVRRRNDSRRRASTFGTIRRPGRIGHLGEIRERAAVIADIFVQRHCSKLLYVCDSTAAPAGAALPRQATRARSTPPPTWAIGPDAFGFMSNSKISVGSHSVAHALGISTIPLMWPSTGAVPRMA